MKKHLLLLVMPFSGFLAQAVAQTPASVSYTPTWQARHHLQWLSDHAGLPLPVSQWPLPAAAVQQALDELMMEAVGPYALPFQPEALELKKMSRGVGPKSIKTESGGRRFTLAAIREDLSRRDAA